MRPGLQRCLKITWIVGLILLFSILYVQAQGTTYEEFFDDPAIPGWDLTPGVSIEGGSMWIEPGNFASYPGDYELVFLNGLYRWSGDGDFVITYHASGRSGYHLVIGWDFATLQREVDGTLEHLAGAPLPIPVDEWFGIQLVLDGSEHRVLFNGDEAFTYKDQEVLPPGGIAFEVLGENILEIHEIVFGYNGTPPRVGDETAGEVEPEVAPVSEVPSTASLTWVRTGGPLGGLGYDVRMHPDNPDILFVTDSFAGVFTSIDGGATWSPSNNGITTRGGPSGDAIPIFCLTIDPNNPDSIWTGTQNTRGTFKSVDGGQTWEEKVTGIIEWEGGNWQPIWRGDNLARYIIVDPRDSDVLYVSTGIFDREAANSDHTTNTPGGVGVLKSTDGGETWVKMNNWITNLYVGTLFMHPEDPDILLAGAANNAYPEGAGVFLTSNGGESWEKVLDNGIQSVEFAVSNPDIAYAGEPGWIFRSVDGGLNWQVTSGHEPGWGPPGVEAGFPIDFQVDPRDSDRIFANNYGGGNFLSEDGGRSWVVASAGYTGAQVRAIAVSPDEPARVYVSARSGFFGSPDGGSTWTGLVNPEAGGLEWNAVAIDPADPSHILAANNWMGRLLESKDGAQHWRVTDGAQPEMGGWRVISFAPSDPMVVYAGSAAFFSAGGFDSNIPAAGVFVSRDGGASWHGANNSLSQYAHISGLAVAPADPQRVLAAAPVVGLLVTDDGGENWSLASGLPTRSRPLSVSIHPSNQDNVFVGTEFGGLYRSEDGGTTWTPVTAGLPPEATITSIVFNPSDPNIIYTSLIEGGVYSSQDGGSTWLVINNGLRTRAP
jgi:photosystem II stability/assembly factor-like uncharacterized protein